MSELSPITKVLAGDAVRIAEFLDQDQAAPGSDYRFASGWHRRL
jgi:hypothetical protein